MKNLKVAEILEEIADILEMKGVEYKPRAYRKAAQTVRSLSKDIEDVPKDELEDLPGIGESIAEKITEIIKTGSLEYLEELEKEYPLDFESFLSVEGIGPETVKLLFKELEVKNLDDLEKAAKQGKIRKIKGLGKKTEQKILDNIAFAREEKGRSLLGYALPIAEELKNKIREFSGIKKVEIAGSLRRKKETIGDIDILVTTSKPKEFMDFFTSLNSVEKVIAKGESKSTVRLREGIETDVRIIEEQAFGSALLYFTGSKQTNIEMRKIALKKDMKLNEYGLFKNDEDLIAGKTEEEVFRELGMQYIAPELRENRGELDASLNKELPELLSYGDLKGDLHVHTKWSEGTYSIEEMAEAAEKIGHKYIAVTDHAGNLKIAGGLEEKELRKQMKIIDKANENGSDLTVLKGAEVNITSDGKIDVKNSVLKELDVVVASVHSGLRQSKKKLTDRIVSAMENENVDIIAHPTGRKINERRGYDLDLEKIFDVAEETGTFLEINSYPDRLDLNDIHVKSAIAAGCKLVISTDSHSSEHLRYIELGIATARRGWARKKDIVNSSSLKDFRKLLK
jgi:DNA polymerase (family 10)